MKQLHLHTLAAACALVGANAAHATDVFRLEGYGPVARAMGGAATAYDSGPAGMMTNPATLSLMTAGSRLDVGLDLVTTDLSARNRATGESADSSDHSHNRGPYAAPQLSYTTRVGQWTYGLGAFAQGGLGTEYGDNSFLSRTSSGAASGLANSSRLLVLNVPFAASLKVDDRLSVGASVEAVWMGLNLDLLLGADQVGALVGGGRVDGSLLPVLGGLPALDGAHFSLTRNTPVASGVHAFGIGARLGLTYKVAPQTTLGAAYAFKSHVQDLEGHARLTAIDRIAGKVPLDGQIALRDFQMPASLNIGASHQVTDNLMVVVDVSRVFWKDAMENIDVGFVATNGATLNIRLPQNYRDQTIGAFGAAYKTGNWTLRGGLRVASQALRPELLFAVIPATPRRHLTAGASYEITAQDSVHVAYAHAFRESMGNASLPNTSAAIDTRHAQDNLVLAYTRRF